MKTYNDNITKIENGNALVADVTLDNIKGLINLVWQKCQKGVWDDRSENMGHREVIHETTAFDTTLSGAIANDVCHTHHDGFDVLTTGCDQNADLDGAIVDKQAKHAIAQLAKRTLANNLQALLERLCHYDHSDSKVFKRDEHPASLSLVNQQYGVAMTA